MRYTQLFAKTNKTVPADADSKNAALLTQAGFIHKQMAGVYSYLPLGLRVLNKIQDIIREEMHDLGSQEILMPALSQEESWVKTQRDQMDVLFHLQGKNEAKLVLNPTHEEVLTPLMKKYISSYRDLPAAVYQFQTKFRNEARAKSGLLRGREFIMKDLYSFHASKEDLDDYYEKVKEAYFKIFNKIGIGHLTFLTFASGGTFSKYSHEFQTLCQIGEDNIYLCPKCKVAVNEEIIKEQNVCPECKNQELTVEKAVEAGNIFKLGAKFSEPFSLTYRDAQGKEILVEMGCYGIGPSRIMGILAELFNDEKGLIWPESVAPFKIHLLFVENKIKEVVQATEKIYIELLNAKIEVLYDDRIDVSAGEKFADADLLGLPLRVVISKKTLEKKSAEIKTRKNGAVSLTALNKLTAGL